MWICARCHTENRDSAAACEGCGAVRSAGRFGSAPARVEHTVRSPRVSAPVPPASPAAEPHRPPASARASYQAPDPEVLPVSPRRRRATLARIVGGTLCVLLPLLTALLAWRQYDALSGALLPLLLGDGAGEVPRLLCYIALALTAGLLSLLPGLWTLLLAGPRSPKHRE